jgi:hypothetical protein
MSCPECKKKEILDNKFSEYQSGMGRGIIIFVIVWSLLAIYGAVTLISKIL